VYKKHNKVLPDDPWEQLRMGIDAVFRSWNIPRAVKYREINKITGLRGTAVNVQTMVYGNINDNSGTGALGLMLTWGSCQDAACFVYLPIS
jgi:pyruvate,orthophosphate dikinase